MAISVTGQPRHRGVATNQARRARALLRVASTLSTLLLFSCGGSPAEPSSPLLGRWASVQRFTPPGASASYALQVELTLTTSNSGSTLRRGNWQLGAYLGNVTSWSETGTINMQVVGNGGLGVFNPTFVLAGTPTQSQIAGPLTGWMFTATSVTLVR